MKKAPKFYKSEKFTNRSFTFTIVKCRCRTSAAQSTKAEMNPRADAFSATIQSNARE